MRFVAIDVETANPDMGSICQVGVAVVEDGRFVGEWQSLIDPEDYFDAVNISVHGIEPHMVIGKPTLAAAASTIRGYLDNTVTVCHTHFDRIAISRAFGRYHLATPAARWLDSARVVRRTWADLAYRGYGLANVCERIGYRFRHHDALEDAKAAGQVLLAAMAESRIDLDGWLRRVEQPIDPDHASTGKSVTRAGNPEGDLSGEVIVFTGALELTRNEAADMAAGVGCDVAPGVTKKTTILVVGDQDIGKLNGHEKSAKHRKAEQLIAEGCAIRIVRESDFRLLVGVTQPACS
jgi:DNA polymerase-3 subunit epsilon